MSLPSAFEIGLIRPVIQGITDILAAGISVSVTPEVREPFIDLPGLRGYWPMSAVDFLGNAKDHSAASSDLARSGAPTFGFDGNSYVQMGVANDFLQGSTSAQSISGTETWIDPAIRGLTVGCWLNLGTLPPTDRGLVTRWYTPPNRSYALYLVSAGVCIFGVSSNGTLFQYAQSAGIATGQWTFLVGRFTPSTEVAVFVNGVKVTNTTSIPAATFTATATFEVGRTNANNANIVHGKIRDGFLCQTALTDVQIENLRLASLPAT